MEWSLIEDQDGVSIGNFESQGPYQDGLGRYLISLLLERVAKEFSLGELSKLASTFLKDFLRFKGQ